MIKSLTAGEIRVTFEEIFQNWESSKNNIRLSGKNLYSLIGLKKKIENEMRNIQETINVIAEQNGGQPQDNGGYFIPEENREKVNQMLAEFTNNPIEIEYTPIHISDDDSIPTGIMEALFDFIEFE